MINWAQFHFLRPYWLLALLPLVIVLWLMLTKKLGNRSWENVCDTSLLPYILIGNHGGIRRTSVILTAVCGLLAIVSLAGPVWKKIPQPVFSSRTALVIALDLSLSMDANDISPSRLARARFKIADILNKREEGQTALLVYAGDAFTVTPLTDDTETIASQLTALSTGLMPIPGNRTDLALSLAEDLLKQAGAGQGDILLITDEINLSRSESRAESLRAEGYRVSVMGVGTEQGVPIPLEDGGFLKDNKGQIIIPVLDEAPMRSLAAAGGGRYVRLGIDDSDVVELERFFSVNANRNDATATELQTDVWQEEGPWLLVLLLPLVAMVFRKGYLVILLFICLPFPKQAQAFDWDSLWLRSDQRAQRALEAGDTQQAVKLFNDPAWKGAAQYKSGDYEAAIKSLDNLEGVEDLYNKGNALAKAGYLQEAIAAYEKVLERMPGHEDAKYNKQLLEEELKKQQQQKQNQQQQSKQDKKDSQQQQDSGKQQNKGQQQKDGKKDEQQQSGQQEKSAKDQSGQQQQAQEKPQSGEQKAGKQEEGQANKMREQDNKEKAQDEQENQAAVKNEKSGNEPEQNNPVPSSDDRQPDEEQQATEQWLRRIPDDPAGLLRRKFLYQYQQRQSQQDSGEKTW